MDVMVMIMVMIDVVVDTVVVVEEEDMDEVEEEVDMDVVVEVEEVEDVYHYWSVTWLSIPGMLESCWNHHPRKGSSSVSILTFQSSSHTHRADEIKRLFDKYGEVKDVYIPMNFYTK